MLNTGSGRYTKRESIFILEHCWLRVCLQLRRLTWTVWKRHECIRCKQMLTWNLPRVGPWWNLDCKITKQNVMKYLCWQVQSGQSKQDMHMVDIISPVKLFAWKPREASDSREQLSCTINCESLSWREHQPYSTFQSSFGAWHNQLLCSASRACTGRKCSIVEGISKCYLFHVQSSAAVLYCISTKGYNTGVKQTALRE